MSVLILLDQFDHDGQVCRPIESTRRCSGHLTSHVVKLYRIWSDRELLLAVQNTPTLAKLVSIHYYGKYTPQSKRSYYSSDFE